ncbi:hypothetical protein ACET3Z_021225 [Daucus carota]
MRQLQQHERFKEFILQLCLALFLSFSNLFSPFCPCVWSNEKIVRLQHVSLMSNQNPNASSPDVPHI